MRYASHTLRIAAFLGAVTVLACSAKEEAATPDSTAAAAAAAPPPAVESFTMVGNDGSWSGDITPAGIIFRRKAKDSLVFDFKPPTATGAILDYESLMTGKDTVRITISLAMTKCTDKTGKEYTHLAQVYLTGDVTLQSAGCAIKK